MSKSKLFKVDQASDLIRHGNKVFLFLNRMWEDSWPDQVKVQMYAAKVPFFH